MVKYEYLTIGELCTIVKGDTGIASALPGEYPLVNTSAERKTCNTFQFDTEAVCIPLVSSTGHGKKTLNYVHYQSGKFALGSILAAVIPKNTHILSAGFLHRYLQFYKDRIIVPLMKGAANVSLAVKDIAKIKIPIIPIEEQNDFINLFNKANEYKINLVSEFEHQSTYLSKLRQAILQEAIEGKLTAEWRKKNPVIKGDPSTDAKALIEKIKAEKQKLIAEGKIKKEKPMAPINHEDIPFDLPEGWVWCRLGDVCSHISDIDHKMPKAVNNGIKFISAKDLLNNGTINFTENIKYISEQDFEKLSRKILPRRDDIIYSRIGACLGKARIVETDEKFLASYSCCTIRPLNPFIKYVSWLLESKTTLNQATFHTTKNSIPDLGIEKIKSFIIGLPCLKEQQVIVEGIENALAIVNNLENQVSERKQQAEQLMQAVLREAFEG